ncbi:flagellar hook-basal body protein, FlgE/F/G, partial [Candidatus Magnetomorum sp. HK-1]
MFKGIYTAASGMLSDDLKMDIVTNNLANINTNGYKQAIITQESFAARMTDKMYAHYPEGVVVRGSSTNFEDGNLVATEANLDIALASPGFFTIEKNQTNKYTRNGALQIDENGFLVTKTGNHKILGHGGPI